MPTIDVQCLRCGAPMRRGELVARARHTHVRATLHVQWVCDTIDCGTEVVIEDDD